MKNIIKKLLRFKMFHPAEWFVDREPTIDPQVLSPPSWRERQIQNEMIDRKYEESVKARSNDQDPSWADKYDKDFKNMKQEVVRVIEVNE
jgi:hypothetical protein